MSVIQETRIETSAVSYPTIDAFRTAVSDILGAETRALVSSAATSGDMEEGWEVLDEISGNYVLMIYTRWVDQEVLDAHLADASIADQKAILEETFTVTRNIV